MPHLLGFNAPAARPSLQYPLLYPLLFSNNLFFFTISAQSSLLSLSLSHTHTNTHTPTHTSLAALLLSFSKAVDLDGIWDAK